MTNAPPIVLVHGAWYGGWCWREVAVALNDFGHRVVAVDLPGRPGNPLPIAQVTLERWIDHTRSIVEATGEPVLLAAHSLGGVVITGVAQAIPSLVSAVVFIGAFLLRDGEAAVDVIRRDPGCAIAEVRELAADGGSSRVDPRLVGDILCGGCDPGDVALVANSLVEETTAVARTSVRWTDDRFGVVPRHFVECTQDRVISIGAQRAMHQATPCERILTLETGHAPFFSEPTRLASILDGVAVTSGTVSSA